MSADVTPAAAPVTPDKLIIKVGDVAVTLFMSYNLNNAIAGVLASGATTLATAAIEGDARNQILNLCLQKQGRFGYLEKGQTIDDLEPDALSREDAFKVVEWANQHGIEFFMQAAEVTKRIGGRYSDALRNLMGSESGSTGSASSKGSAGSSTQPLVA